MLVYEKELLGFYVTGHPLDEYAGSLETSKFRTILDLENVEGTETVKIGGLILSLEKKFTRKDNKPFASFILEDFTGSIELTAWDETLAKYAELLQPGQAIAASARASRRDENLRLQVQSVEELKKRGTKRPVEICLRRSRLDEAALVSLAELLRRHNGKRPVELVFVGDAGGRAAVRAGKTYLVGDEFALRGELLRECPEILANLQNKTATNHA
jgi:DNA polymerase-3 subunit alpha